MEREFVIKWNDQDCKSVFLNIGILVGTVEFESDAEAKFVYDDDSIPVSVELRIPDGRSESSSGHSSE